MMDKHAVLKLHNFFKELIKTNPDKVIEEQIGMLIDSVVHDLYWSNSMFSSFEFGEIVHELESTDALKVPEIKKRLFREIMRNLICLSMSKSHEGHFQVSHILPIYILHGIYVKNIFSIINTSDILYNTKHQLSFVNSLICTYNFPSQYDTTCKLLSFARECLNMSEFVRQKGASCPPPPCVKSRQSSVDCSPSTLPNSIDKIIETITKVLETEKTQLDPKEQNILNDIDSEIGKLL